VRRWQGPYAASEETIRYVTLSMAEAERETFLADLHVGVINIARKDRDRHRAWITKGASTPGGGDNILVKMQPQRWLTADCSKLMSKSE